MGREDFNAKITKGLEVSLLHISDQTWMLPSSVSRTCNSTCKTASGEGLAKH